MKKLSGGPNNSFELSLNSFTWRSWAIAGCGAILLNCTLFLFLPLLLQSPPPSEITDIIDRVEVIRFKKYEPPARKKPPTPKEKPKEKPEIPKEQLKAPKPVVPKKLMLPFQLNSQLPSLSSDFQIPFSDNIGYGSLHGSIVDMAQLDKPLTPITKIPPTYPIRARRKGIEGWVKVQFEVDEHGSVSQLQILEGKPTGVFDKSVFQCVSRWRFKPGTIEGVPVRARMETTIRFKME